MRTMALLQYRLDAPLAMHLEQTLPGSAVQEVLEEPALRQIRLLQ